MFFVTLERQGEVFRSLLAGGQVSTEENAKSLALYFDREADGADAADGIRWPHATALNTSESHGDSRRLTLTPGTALLRVHGRLDAQDRYIETDNS